MNSGLELLPKKHFSFTSNSNTFPSNTNQVLHNPTSTITFTQLNPNFLKTRRLRNYSLLMQQPQTPPTPEAKNRFIDLTSLQFWKRNLSLIVIIPYILGGIWQIIELSTISLAYIRFFSVTQSISDGLLVLVVLFLIVSILWIWRRRDVTERMVRKWLMTETNVDVKIIVVLLTVTLSIILLLPLFAMINDNWMIVSLITLFVLWLAIFLSKDRFSNSQSETVLQKAKIGIFQWARLVLILVFIGYLIGFTPFFFQNLRKSLTSLEDNVNIMKQKQLIARKIDRSNNFVDVIYFNDQFIFWKVYVNSEKNVLVTSFNATFSMDSLPEIRSLWFPETRNKDSVSDSADQFNALPVVESN